MSKIDSMRLLRSSYPVHHEISTRVSDLDGYGHINGIQIGQFYEDARANLYNIFAQTAPRLRVPVAQLTLRYLGECRWPGQVEVSSGILRIGRSSFELVQALWQADRCIGLCDSAMVHSVDGKAEPLTAAYREALERHSLRPAAQAIDS